MIETGFPELRPIFGFHAFGADTTCAHVHKGPLPKFTKNVCMVCNRTGEHTEAKIRAAAHAQAAKERREREAKEAERWARIKAQKFARQRRKAGHAA